MEAQRETAKLVLRAASFAAEKHRNQRRKNGEKTPYINHPLGVAHILAENGVTDGETLAAALLHDTVEDTDTSPQELQDEFGSRIAAIVAEVTDDKALPKATRKRIQVDHAREASVPAKLVKMADALHNMGSFFTDPPRGWPAERIQGYFVWKRKVLGPCRGFCEGLDRMLDAMLCGSFTLDGECHPCLPEGDLDAFLEGYYRAMEQVAE